MNIIIIAIIPYQGDARQADDNYIMQEIWTMGFGFYVFDAAIQHQSFFL